ncbi:hypothetical protein [Streptomyces sp. NPDC002463]|uniref:hypothetical protein n=1 Tax=Streptomyces sp. NPDC002463 TaxID=3364645 RepID=UPI00369C4D7B
MPTMYWALLDEDVSAVDLLQITKNMRIAVSGGVSPLAENHRRFAERFSVAIREGYGLSETSPIATFSVRAEDVRPDAVGEIVIRGHNVM